MTRFAMEISGNLGEYWKKHAKEEVKRLLAQTDNIEVEEDGAAKWISSGNYLPEEVVEKLTYGGATWFSPEATAWKRKEQTNETLKAYRARGTQDDIDFLNSARAAFGKGETIVDIITGERIAL